MSVGHIDMFEMMSMSCWDRHYGCGTVWVQICVLGLKVNFCEMKGATYGCLRLRTQDKAHIHTHKYMVGLRHQFMAKGSVYRSWGLNLFTYSKTIHLIIMLRNFRATHSQAYQYLNEFAKEVMNMILAKQETLIIFMQTCLGELEKESHTWSYC